jgi:ornithine cyclodeaminase
MIHIDFDSVHRLATVASLIEPIRRAFAANTVSPERVHYDLDASGPPRTLLLMPCWHAERGIGVKIVTVFPDNAERALPSVNASYVLLSFQSGQPLAMIDGRSLTLLRTAAVSALAADLLAPANPDVLLMVGTGALSRCLIEGHTAVRRYQSIRIWGRDPHKAAAVARALNAWGGSVSVAPDLETAVRSADVISCATMSADPLIKGSWLKSACHLDLVGSFKPTLRETDDDCMRGAFIAVDTLAALEESGDLSQPLANGLIDKAGIALLGALAARKGKAPRPAKTVFKSIGVAHADLAAAHALYERRQDHEAAAPATPS